MLRLSLEEGQRLYNVLRATVLDTRHVGLVPERPDDAFTAAVSELEDDESAVAMEDIDALWRAEASFRTVDARERDVGMPSNLSALPKVSGQVAACTRRVCRAVTAAPAVAAALARRTPSEGMERLCTVLEELTAINKKLAQPPGTVHDGDRPPTPDSDTIKAITIRQQRLDSDIDTLEAELAAAQRVRSAEVSSLDDELKVLSTELLQLKQSARAEQQELETRTAEVHEEVKVSHDSNYDRLVEELEKAAARADEQALEELKEKSTLRKRVNILEKEVSKSIASYDEKMMEMQDEIIAIERQRAEDGKRLSRLVEHFDLLDSNQRTADTEEDEYQALLAQRAAGKLQVETAAALPIQRMFRRVQAEKARLEAEAKAKKGKRGKKGKK